MPLASVEGIHGKEAWLARAAQPHTGCYRAKDDRPSHFPTSSSPVNLGHHLLSISTSHRSIVACDSPVISWLCFRYPGSIIPPAVCFPGLHSPACQSPFRTLLLLTELLRSLHSRTARCGLCALLHCPGVASALRHRAAVVSAPPLFLLFAIAVPVAPSHPSPLSPALPPQYVYG